VATPIIIVKENGLVIEVKFIGDPGELNPQKLDNTHVILRWPNNEMARSVGESELVLDKQLGESPQFEIRLQAKETVERTAS
jgi:hypothetical protein